MSRGELYVSKWCQRIKNDRLKEKERERRKDPTGVDTVIYNKKGGLLPKS